MALLNENYSSELAQTRSSNFGAQLGDYAPKTEGHMNLAAARPYAKVIFDLALHNHQVLEWQETLKKLALVATECKKNGLLNNPKINSAQKADLFTDAIEKSPEAMNLVNLLAERKKLAILPNIAASYKQLLFTHNNTLEVKIISAHELTTAQKEQLLNALEKRYQNKILLQYHIDAELIGGAVIYISDKVIDGSIKSMLQRLKQNLLLKKSIC